MNLSNDPTLKSLSVEKTKEAPASNIENLLTWSDLSYKVPMPSSVVSRRTVKKQDFQLSSYSSGGQSMICYIQSGDDYIDFKNSVLLFGLANTVATTAVGDSFGSGSAFNIIKDVIITSDNKEIDRFEKANVFRAHYDRLHESPEWFSSVGLAMGYGAADVATGAVTEYTIPMNKLAPIFDNGKLMPHLMSQRLKIEIVLETPKTVLTLTNVSASPSFVVSNPRILLDSHMLTDVAHEQLKKNSVNGLEFPYESVFSDLGATTTAVATLQISKAVGRAMRVFTVTRLTANLADEKEDSFATEDSKALATGYINAARYRLGSAYFPDQPMTGNPEVYYHMLHASRKLSDGKTHPSSVTDANVHQFTQLYASLESLALLKYSGSALNNHRSLTFNVTYLGAASRTLNIYMTYLSVAKIYMQGILIDS